MEAFRYFAANYDPHNSPLMSEGVLWVIPYSACVLYMGMLLWWRDLAPQGWEKPLLPYLAAWNLFLSVGSLALLVVWAPAVLSFWYEHGIYQTVCQPDAQFFQIGGVAAFCGWIFAVSKIVELIDTVFMVLRRKPVEFLHSYHHVTVLLFCWFCVYSEFPPGMMFGIINAFVHTVMYFYYFLTATGFKPSWGHHVTRIQIGQMFVGSVFSAMWAVYHYILGYKCEVYRSTPLIAVIAAGLLYGSYMFLFVRFYSRRSQRTARPKTDTKSVETAKSK